MEMLRHYNVQLKGKKCTVVGRSLVVGKPLAMLLLREHATVTICHSRTEDLHSVCKDSDVLIAAVGKAKMIKGNYVKPGQVVIDVGINPDRKTR
jgi:methylenetetrahydrofolate dehydrogenase (NADP+)/methenyltetrahydrofolate cyclohydrolase